MSTPTSAIASMTAGLISSPGSLPADRTWILPSERSLTSPAAIWLRPALCTQTNRTSGTSSVIRPAGSSIGSNTLLVSSSPRLAAGWTTGSPFRSGSRVFVALHDRAVHAVGDLVGELDR